MGTGQKGAGSQPSVLFAVCLKEAKISLFLIPAFTSRIVFLPAFALKVETN